LAHGDDVATPRNPDEVIVVVPVPPKYEALKTASGEVVADAVEPLTVRCEKGSKVPAGPPLHDWVVSKPEASTDTQVPAPEPRLETRSAVVDPVPATVKFPAASKVEVAVPPKYATFADV